MPISHLFGVVCDKCQEIKNVPNWDIFLFDYISDGIFMPIKSIVLANVSRAIVAMCRRPACVFCWNE